VLLASAISTGTLSSKASCSVRDMRRCIVAVKLKEFCLKIVKINSINYKFIKVWNSSLLPFWKNQVRLCWPSEGSNGPSLVHLQNTLNSI